MASSLLVILLWNSLLVSAVFCQAFQLRHSYPTARSTLNDGIQIVRTRNCKNCRMLSLYEKNSGKNNDVNIRNNQIDVSGDDRLYRIRISRAPGIEWGTVGWRATD